MMLDRLSVLIPDWNSGEVADLGVALVELLAYVGDQLSYYQDAVATEAYLGTARRRVSVRRHARLVDYRVHDGCNARAWVQIQLAQADLGGPDGGIVIERGRRLLTSLAGFAPVLDESDYRRALGSSPEVFETLHDLRAFRAHQELAFYAWGGRSCCLPAGATRATLRGRPQLQAGDVLVLVERLRAGDRRPGRRRPRAPPGRAPDVRRRVLGSARRPLRRSAHRRRRRRSRRSSGIPTTRCASRSASPPTPTTATTTTSPRRSATSCSPTTAAPSTPRRSLPPIASSTWARSRTPCSSGPPPATAATSASAPRCRRATGPRSPSRR